MSTKVSIDNAGLLKVTHMINMADGPPGAPAGGAGASSAGVGGAPVYTQTQTYEASKVGVVQFVMVALDEVME